MFCVQRSASRAAPTEICDGIDNNCDGQIDEPGAGLCDSGEVCTNGMCQPPNDDGNGDGEGAMPAGCACNTSGMPTPGASVSVLLLGAVLLRRRR